jgi:hypothetical protein
MSIAALQYHWEILLAVVALSLVSLTLFRVWAGLRLSLYLLNDDSIVRDQVLIPVTFSGRKRSIVQCLREGRWKDDVELTLMDYQSRAYKVRVTYGLWRRFRLEFRGGPAGLKLGRTEAVVGQKYTLRSGMKLETGGRRYEVKVLPDQPELVLRY